MQVVVFLFLLLGIESVTVAWVWTCLPSTSVGGNFMEEGGRVLTEAPDVKVYAEYVLRVNGLEQADLDYSSRTVSTQTSWFGVRFDRGLMTCVTGPCTQPAYRLQSALFNQQVAFAKKSIIVRNQNQWPDVQLGLGSSPRFGMTGLGGRGAIWTNGCTPPQFRVRVTYAATTEIWEKQSQPCFRRTIMFMDVSDDDSGVLACKLRYGPNGLLGLLDTANAATKPYAERRLAAMAVLRQTAFAESGDGNRKVLLSDSQIGNMIDCVEPTSGSIGGKWSETSSVAPGLCVKCTAATVPHSSVRYCNRSVPADRTGDCCYQCARGYMWKGGGCVLECARNWEFNTQLGVCQPCGAGLFSEGATDSCKTCAQRGVPNGRVDALRGCIACEATQIAVGSVCTPCPTQPEQQVFYGGACTACSSLGAFYYSPANSSAPCAPCSAGTYMQDGKCQACPPNTYARLPQATVCVACAVGHRAVANRTLCVPCPPINQTSMYYSRYLGPGCNMQCAAGAAYAAASPYTAGGCKACNTVVVPIGSYQAPTMADCSRPLPCTNAPRYGFLPPPQTK
jgi:hypothetical protein